MYLSSIILRLESGSSDFRNAFLENASVIGFYLYQNCLRKIVFDTSEPFYSIRIQVFDLSEPQNVDFYPDTYISREILHVNIEFDSKRYRKLSAQEKCEYALELYEKGIRKAMTVSTLPYDEIKQTLEQLRVDGFKYEWTARSMLVKDFNIKIKFDCTIDTEAFTMTASAYRLKPHQGEPLCSAVIIKTLPNEINFDHVTSKKNSFIREGDKVYICARWGTRFFYMNLKEIESGVMKIHSCPPDYPDDPNDTETFYELQNDLKPEKFTPLN